MNLPLRLQSPALLVAFIILSLHSCAPGSREGESNESNEANAATVAFPTFDDVDPIIKSQLTGFLTEYFALNQALIVDSLEGAKVAALRFVETTKKFEISKLTVEQMDFFLVQSSKLNDALVEIGDSNEIGKARTGLATASEAMYALVKAFHPNETPLYYQYCPMARDNQGANWLSSTEKLVNPYMGQMMLECGKTVEKLGVGNR